MRDRKTRGRILRERLAPPLLLGLAIALGAHALRATEEKGGDSMTTTDDETTATATATASESDEAELLDHVHRIFQAFLDRDRDRIEELHSEDWIGFLGPSTEIERGIEDYMAGADRSLGAFRGVSYEILDSEVRIHGDTGLVFYVARYVWDNGDERGVVPLRSVDVFRRRDGEWIQTASHIAVVPSGGRWGEGE